MSGSGAPASGTGSHEPSPAVSAASGFDPSRAGFRWEPLCLSDDPFAGDFGDGEIALSDKMVTNRKGGTCHTCAGECLPGTRNRVIVERGGDGLSTYRFCQSCCFAMAVYDIRPSIGDRLFALGQERRAEGIAQPSSTPPEVSS